MNLDKTFILCLCVLILNCSKNKSQTIVSEKTCELDSNKDGILDLKTKRIEKSNGTTFIEKYVLSSNKWVRVNMTLKTCEGNILIEWDENRDGIVEFILLGNLDKQNFEIIVLNTNNNLEFASPNLLEEYKTILNTINK